MGSKRMLGDIEKSQLPHLSVELHDAKMGHLQRLKTKGGSTSLAMTFPWEFLGDLLRSWPCYPPRLGAWTSASSRGRGRRLTCLGAFNSLTTVCISRAVRSTISPMVKWASKSSRTLCCASLMGPIVPAPAPRTRLSVLAIRALLELQQLTYRCDSTALCCI